MKIIDPSEQWRNFKKTYSIMHDDELQAIANEAYDLTDIAKQALQSEISARGLTIQLKDKPATAPDWASRRPEPDLPEMTVIRRVWDISEADEIQEFLLSAGVTSYLGPDNLDDVNDFQENFERGVDLRIARADEQLAYRALAQFKPSQNQRRQQIELAMKSTDQSEQWRNLKETYSRISEDELLAIANHAYDLTDIAKQVLQFEIASRGLNIQLQGKPCIAPDSVGRREPDEMTVLQRVWDISEAREMQEFLRSAGIASYLGPDNLEDVDDFHGNFERGVDLKIFSAYLDLAYRALARFKPCQDQDEQQVGLIADDGKYDVRCPKCRSFEITFEGRDPAPPKDDGFHSKFNWSCEDCGHQWKDDGIEEKVG